MSWSIKGSYFETCSCELMCPCNLSFDHGATYDYCRVTLVFNVREGEVEGTDVGGVKRIVLGHSHTDHRGTAPELNAPVYYHPNEMTYAERDAWPDYWDMSKLPVAWISVSSTTWTWSPCVAKRTV